MARIFIDGFESGSLDLWDTNNGFTINGSISGRQGTYCCFSGSNTNMSTGISSSSEIYMAIKVNITMYPTLGNREFIQFFNGTTILGSIVCTSGGSLCAYKGLGFGGTLLGTSPISPSLSTWYLIEARYKPHLTDGIFQVKLNGVLVIDVSGVSTSSTTSNVDIIKFESLSSHDFYFDDLIFDNANWIGYSCIQKLSPTGAGATTQWDASSGNNWDCVEEIPYSDNDYVSTNVSGEVDTYACANLSGTVNSVKAVQVQARAMREGSASKPNLKLVVRPSSTDRLSDNIAVPIMTPKSLSKVWTLNPDTSAAWVSGEVNAMEIGVRAES